MRLTQHTDYALRVLIYLALDRRRRSTIREISEAYGISRNHLMKVVHELAGRGYVHSVRGVGGGIQLRGAPREINLGQVVRDMEPDFGLVECFRPENDCVITPACRLPAVLERAMRSFMTVLDGCTLADLLPRPARPKLALLLKTGNSATPD